VSNRCGRKPPRCYHHAMRAALLAVGSELLSSDRLDTNSLRIAAALERHGAVPVLKSVVADDVDEIAAALTAALSRADLVVVSGGLGPTADDVTREGCATALGLELVEDAEVWATIERRFASFGRRPAANNRRQALVLAGAEVLRNPRGTAPGQRLEAGSRTLFLLPAVPHELDGLVAAHLEPWLAERAEGAARERATLYTALRPESDVDRDLGPAYEEFGREPITVLASPGEVRVRLTASGPEAERRARLAAMTRRVRELLGDSVYGEGEDCSLERVVGELLAGRKASVATAESCTGGLVAERLTRIAGASGWFPGGVVTYSNERKVDWLDVPERDLGDHGAVSETVARAMAEGIRARAASDFGVAVTGIAGPTGGSADKPVGTVHIAVAGPAGTHHRKFLFPGDRERVRQQSSQAALEMLRRELLGAESGAVA
jgi:nicotinamide-nucleotide amidase